MYRYEQNALSRRISWMPVGLGLLALLVALPCAAQDDEVDRRVERKVNRVVVDSDPFMQTMPCENIETDHPDAVRRSQRGFLGVELTPLTDELLRHFGVTGDGVMISKIEADSPAQRSGLKVGDIISRFDGHVIDSTLGLGRAVRDLPGRAASAEVWRDGKMQKVSVTVGKREMCSLDLGALMDGLDFHFEGIDFDAEAFGRMAEKLGAQSAEMGLRVAEEVTRAMSEVDWEQQMQTIEELTEIDEERMEALQQRLQELEQRMEAEYERFGEKYERELEKAMREKERALHAQERELRQQMEKSDEQRRRQLEQGQARAEELRRKAEQKAAEAEERARAEAERQEAEAQDDGGGTINI